MKYFPWIATTIIACHSILACSSDSNSGAGPGTAGAAGTSGAAGSAGASGSAGNAASDIVQTAIAAGNFTKLASALTSAGLVDTLQGPGPFTVFAPTDAAFDAFEAANPGKLASLSNAELSAVLTYHVVPGTVNAKDLKNNGVLVSVLGAPILIDKGASVKLTDGVKTDDASVTTADIAASNGVIHVIDFVILPPAKDIVDTAVAAGTFTQLAGALQSASLVDALKGAGPFTVFAPTDAAFSALGTAPTGDALANVLKYHVVPAAAGSGDLSDGQQLPTLDSATTSKLGVDLSSGVKIKDSTTSEASVTAANILAKNGVIHVVDKVLIPN